jgi:hypothetical protein
MNKRLLLATSAVVAIATSAFAQSSPSTSSSNSPVSHREQDTSPVRGHQIQRKRQILRSTIRLRPRHRLRTIRTPQRSRRTPTAAPRLRRPPSGIRRALRSPILRRSSKPIPLLGKFRAIRRRTIRRCPRIRRQPATTGCRSLRAEADPPIRPSSRITRRTPRSVPT